jgi:hypothetical protein
MGFPVWIERYDLSEASCEHPAASSLPLGRYWYVKNQQVFWRGRGGNRMGAAARKFEVVARTFNAKHDTVESLVILEASDNVKAEATTIHGCAPRKIANWSGDPEVRWHGALPGS